MWFWGKNLADKYLTTATRLSRFNLALKMLLFILRFLCSVDGHLVGFIGGLVSAKMSPMRHGLNTLLQESALRKERNKI